MTHDCRCSLLVNVSHLAGFASSPTHVILDRQPISDKAEGLVYRT